MIGEAIGVMAPGSARGEIALSVADDWQLWGEGCTSGGSAEASQS
jgi:hypothetical protein